MSSKGQQGPILVSSSKDKTAEIGRALGRQLRNSDLDLEEIQSLNLEEIVYDKALRAYLDLGEPVLVEDVSLVFLARGLLPGTLIRWFFQELGNEGLCQMIDGDRRARAEVCYGLCLDGHQVELFAGSKSGQIALRPRGRQGFAWDAIFVPETSTHTWAEMEPREKDQHSMRAAPLARLAQRLDELSDDDA